MVDDLAFLTLVEMERQYMLDCGHGFAGKNIYGIHPTKSCILTYLSSHSGVEKKSPTLYVETKYSKPAKPNI